MAKTKRLSALFCAYDHINYIGGPNIWLERTLPVIADLDVDLHLFLISESAFDNSSFCNEIKKDKRIKLHFYVGSSFLRDMVAGVRQVLLDEKPDVFIPSLNYPALIATQCARQLGIPSAGVLHSNDAYYKSILETFGSKKQDMTRFRLDALVGISHQLTDWARENCHEDIIFRHIAYGSPIPEEKARWLDGKIKLIYTGRLEDEAKQITQTARGIIRAVKDLRTLKNLDARAVIVGDGSKRELVENMIADSNLEKEIIVTGRLAKFEDLQKQLLDSQVFVFLSDYEGFGLSLAEAMACGLPSICYKMPKNCGIYDLIIDGENGLLVKDRDEDFVKAVKKITDNGDLWQKMSDNARSHIESNHSVEAWAQVWVDFMQEIVGKCADKKNLATEKSASKLGQLIMPPRLEAFDGYGLRDTWQNHAKVLKEKVSWHLCHFLKKKS